jgi:hypothetical protein
VVAVLGQQQAVQAAVVLVRQIRQALVLLELKTQAAVAAAVQQHLQVAMVVLE